MTIAPEKPMDLEQATQRLNWLDGERRRDHAELARLAQELAGAVAILKDQAAKVRESSERVHAVESTLAHLPRLEDAITATRSELPPLYGADVRLEDEIARRGKDARTQADQTARLWSEMNGRLETLSRNLEVLGQRIQVLDTQRKENADRVAQVFTRIEGLAATAATLTDRLQLLDAQRKSQTERATEVAARLDVVGKSAEGLASRLQLLEARERDQVSRDATLQAQMSRLQTTQGQALEDVKRAVARAEALFVDNQQIRRDISLAQDEDAKRRKEAAASLGEMRDGLATAQRQIEDILAVQAADAKWQKDDAAALVEQKEAVALALRQIDEILESDKATDGRLIRLEELPTQATQIAARLAMAEEHIGVLQSTYSALQEVEDRHWNTDIPEVLRQVEESSATTASNAVTVQELVAGSQALKEAVREVQVALVNEHTFSEELAAALRGVIEEDLQTRLATTQKQLQTLRRLANAPAESPQTND